MKLVVQVEDDRHTRHHPLGNLRGQLDRRGLAAQLPEGLHEPTVIGPITGRTGQLSDLRFRYSHSVEPQGIDCRCWPTGV